ncbi:glycosyltransferase family 2 protein [Candidatus Uhrbacteria bacterium]|nr:glycosyltransferase family 2 protein [Candidatus Uhrbacteria bacterium]
MAIIPAFQEAGRIKNTIEAVKPYVNRVIVVDDGSTDTTFIEAIQSDVTVLRHMVNRGQGAALRTGTEAALRLGAECIIHIDADGQHDPSFIPSIIEPLKKGEAEIVFGSRFLGITSANMPFMRRMVLKAAKTFNTLLMGIPRHVTDPQSGMRAMTAAAARRLNFRQDRMAHCSEILRLTTRGAYKWCEIPVRIHYSSESLAKGQKSSDALVIVWQLFLGIFAD